MVVGQLQQLLERIYDVPLGYDVEQFLLTDRGALPQDFRASATDEQLLVADGGTELSLGLFLDAGVLERLDAANPLERLDGANLADYWTALEGVSHFVYLAWNAAFDRPVSLHELELQAEVDKYAATALLLRAQNAPRFPVELHRVLFERARVSEALAGERAGLYRRANQYAARFCRHLGNLLAPVGAAAQARAAVELRRFYRLTNAMKLRRIECLA
ncbi:MAG TPA: hypothetical protein VMT49_02370 [Steroidobacteraceae bacterium]|nr:hypothetical protein [Steroidobacteraceae bacterium]